MSHEKLIVANDVLHTFAPDTNIVMDGSHIAVEWKTYGAKPTLMKRRWMVRHGQSFYPVWSRRWPHGGTATTALSQLIRWIQGTPVLQASSWRYWASETCRLLPPQAVDRLLAGGYPEHAVCVLCNRQLGSLDWWSLNGVSGPCCHFTTGCRQQPGDGSLRSVQKVGAA